MGPFLLFTALVFRLYWVIARVPGGEPIGGLERGASKVGKFIGRYVPGRRKRAAA